MDGATVIILLILFILIGVVSYYLYDYYYYKVMVADDFNKTNKRVETEGKTRSAYDQDLVKQVNDVNSQIENDVDTIRADMRTDAGNLTKLTTGLNSVMSFTGPVGVGTTVAPRINIPDLPSATAPDMNLLAHVNSLGGLTIKELESTANSKKKFKICGVPSSAGAAVRCTEIPDDNGHTVLKALFDNKLIKINNDTELNGSLDIRDNNGTYRGARIRAGNTASTSFIETSRLGIGTTFAAPDASLHLLSRAADNVTPFKVTIDGSDLVSIGNDGTITTKKIQIPGLPNKANSGGTIEASENGIKITAARVFINGALSLKNKTTDIIPESTETFTSGPIIMKKNASTVKTPVDYMNSRFLMPVH